MVISKLLQSKKYFVTKTLLKR